MLSSKGPHQRIQLSRSGVGLKNLCFFKKKNTPWLILMCNLVEASLDQMTQEASQLEECVRVPDMAQINCSISCQAVSTAESGLPQRKQNYCRLGNTE